MSLQISLSLDHHIQEEHFLGFRVYLQHSEHFDQYRQYKTVLVAVGTFIIDASNEHDSLIHPAYDKGLHDLS
jgi:hypothetical protein